MTVMGVTDCAILPILRHRLHCNKTAIAPQWRRLGFRALPLLRVLLAAPVSTPLASWASWTPPEACCCGGPAGGVSGPLGRSSLGRAPGIYPHKYPPRGGGQGRRLPQY